MNFALDISNRTEDTLFQLMEEKMAEEKTTVISEHEEEELYAIALNRTIEESGIAWAGGNIRIGEIILIVDSDTRVVSWPLEISFILRSLSDIISPAHGLPYQRRRRDVSQPGGCDYPTQCGRYASHKRLLRERDYLLHQSCVLRNSIRCWKW